jgi:hypothetical protein
LSFDLTLSWIGLRRSQDRGYAIRGFSAAENEASLSEYIRGETFRMISFRKSKTRGADL